MPGITSRIAAGVVVLGLLSTAIFAVRGAMQTRQARAERAWRAARQCALECSQSPNTTHTTALRECRATASNAAELSTEMPEHGRPQLELQAALAELVRAIDSGDAPRLTSAIDRASRAGSSLGWAAPRTPVQ